MHKINSPAHCRMGLKPHAPEIGRGYATGFAVFYAFLWLLQLTNVDLGEFFQLLHLTKAEISTEITFFRLMKAKNRMEILFLQLTKHNLGKKNAFCHLVMAIFFKKMTFVS